MVVDVGNTFSKVGIFKKKSLEAREVFDSPAALKRFMLHTQIDHLIISSVTLPPEEVASWSQSKGLKLVLDHTLGLPIQNRYSTPATLGLDRLAAACGAWLLYPNQECLVIDMGTCINYEYINEAGEYLGGAISPGVMMRFEAMHHFTSRLPLASPIDTSPLIGASTVSGLQSGVMNGILEEIKGVIFRYTKKCPGVHVILCGGDAHFFENHLKPSIFVAPDLVLMGLNSILLQNVTS